MAKIISKALDLQAKNVENLPFTDVSPVYREAVAALYENGITTGKTATTFGVTDSVKRGQLAVFVVRAEQAIAKPPRYFNLTS